MIEEQITTRATALFGVVDSINQMLVSYGMSHNLANWLDEVISVTLLFLIAYCADLVGRFIVNRIVAHVAKLTKSRWDDIFLEHKVFRYLTHMIPGMIFFLCTPIAINSAIWVKLFQKAALIYITIAIVRAIVAATQSMTQIYAESEDYARKPVKVLFQIIAVIAYFVGGIVILSILINTSLTTLFAGLGAFMAVLLLIFKDSILGFVAGWQLSSNDMLRMGDWITTAKHGADGTVEEVSLYSVKVRNFDNTIVTIPPYSLVSESFQNWRGMEESEGRRIKRFINIDMTSIKFCTPEMIERFGKIHYLKDYITNTEKIITSYNEENNVDNTVLVNGRRQTNIGVFRAYLRAYINNHPDINQNLTCIVRQLQPSEKGVPVEIYCFTKDKSWVNYENVQSDIFDHIMAIVDQFDLKIYQLKGL
ncbi:MAG: mechanosensitive ion channel family protein [Bacteroidales bacterium]|nr:mechanosensitive ion channel family protein [Bacteroidales bacterium]